MTRRRRLRELYVRIWRTCTAWAPTLLPLAVIVFVPIGLLDGVLHSVETHSLDVTGGFRFFAFLGAAAAITASSLFGEVFFSGAVAISLTHPEHEHPPSIRQIAGHISYLKLIAVDFLYTVAIVAGVFAFVIGAFLVFVYLSLAGPVVELEKHSVRGGFMRSFRLVRGHFWMVAAVVVPIEVIGDFVNEVVVSLAHSTLGEGLLAAWAGESVSNIITAPFFGVAVVLLTLDLIHHRDGTGPILKRRPAPVPAGDAA
ncbi:MAG TPA: hypothetical protein VHA76_02975 [Solirubrobacterales bacterium]|nr:hypothetical protein [Solirubrobacterales bacterium]